jgi:G3E family GTPase
VDLLVEQVEFANVIILNKADLVSSEELASLKLIMQKLNAGALLLESTFGTVSPTLLLNTRRFNIESASEHTQWLTEMKGGHTPETAEYGISSFVYRADRPFHPLRLNRLLGKGFFLGVLRSKGSVCSASDHDLVLEWSQAGRSMNLKPGSDWLQVALPQSEWPAEAAQYKERRYGDRRQEIVFIGPDLNQEEISEQLNKALVTPKEFNLGPKFWSKWMALVTEEAEHERPGRRRTGVKRKHPKSHAEHDGATCTHK